MNNLKNSSIGVDIEEINRFSKKKYNKNKLFYNKVFTDNEIQYCLKKVNPYPHFTARFCAKEAAIKALKDSKILLKDIEIRMEGNFPVLCLPKNKKGIVSLSHSKEFAIAVVLIN